MEPWLSPRSVGRQRVRASQGEQGVSRGRAGGCPLPRPGAQPHQPPGRNLAVTPLPCPQPPTASPPPGLCFPPSSPLSFWGRESRSPLGSSPRRPAGKAASLLRALGSPGAAVPPRSSREGFAAGSWPRAPLWVGSPWREDPRAQVSGRSPPTSAPSYAPSHKAPSPAEISLLPSPVPRAEAVGAAGAQPARKMAEEGQSSWVLFWGGGGFGSWVPHAQRGR